MGIIALSQFYLPKNPLKGFSDNAEICQGFIDSLPVAGTDGTTKLLVRLSACKEGDLLKAVSGRVQLTISQIPPSPPLLKGGKGGLFSYGDIIRFKTRLHEPSDFKNPHGFKYKRYCASRGINLLGFIDDPNWIIKIGVVKGHYLKMAIEKLRWRIGGSLRAIPDENLRGVARALLIGDGSEISEETKEDFRKSGLMHILIISGLNVAFVALAVFFVFKWILLFISGFALRYNIFKPTALFTIAAVWFYAYITGAEVSVVRSAIMATVYLAGIMFDKRQDIFTSLALAALIILAISPLAVYDISFQLSFITVMAIAIVYPAIVKKFAWLRAVQGETRLVKIRRYILETAAVSVSATIGAAPLLAYYFHYSSFIGILANIFVVPWAGFVITPAGLIVGLIGAVSENLARLPVIFWSYLLVPMMKSASLSAGISKPFTLAVTPPLTAIIMFYCIVLFVCYPVAAELALLKQVAAKLALLKQVAAKLALPKCSVKAMLGRVTPAATNIAIGLCLVILIASFAFQRGWFSPRRLEVTFLDVGQGSSIVVKFPSRKVMVIDGGGFKKSPFDIGKFVIAPYLWHEGISHIDWLILTHAHPDHFKGLAFLVEEFSPKVFIWNGIPPSYEDDQKEWEEFNNRIKKTGITPHPLILSLSKDDPEVTFLNPPTKIPSDWNLNDTSIVTKISYGGISFLLTGDIESKAERNISPQQITVLQVPHHGSATSTSGEFLSAVKPQYAVIQAGKNNKYGFPSAKILERLNKSGAKVQRTDIIGAITFKTDGRRLKISPFLKGD